MTRTECWCLRKNGEPIRACMMCAGKGYVETPESNADECPICGHVPTTNEAGLRVSHAVTCPRYTYATVDPEHDPARPPRPSGAPDTPGSDNVMLDFDTVAVAEAPFASGGAADPAPEPAERPETAEEVDEPPGATPGAFEAGMAGSARSADAKWSDEQKVAVRVAVRYAALHNAEFTTDEVWARLRDVDPAFPSSKGMAGILNAMVEDGGSKDPAKMTGPGDGAGLTRSGKPATMRATGRTRKPQREDMNNGQRLAIYESLVYDPGLCSGALAGPIPPNVVGQSDRHRKPGDALLVRCSKCMEPIDVVIYQGLPFLAEHRRDGEYAEAV